jgi:hypothetical protein
MLFLGVANYKNETCFGEDISLTHPAKKRLELEPLDIKAACKPTQHFAART